MCYKRIFSTTRLACFLALFSVCEYEHLFVCVCSVCSFRGVSPASTHLTGCICMERVHMLRRPEDSSSPERLCSSYPGMQAAISKVSFFCQYFIQRTRVWYEQLGLVYTKDKKNCLCGPSWSSQWLVDEMFRFFREILFEPWDFVELSLAARSLGSVALRKAENLDRQIHLNVFTIDFNEELVALYGGSLRRQTQFLHESIKAILRLYKVRGNSCLMFLYFLLHFISSVIFFCTFPFFSFHILFFVGIIHQKKSPTILNQY